MALSSQHQRNALVEDQMSYSRDLPPTLGICLNTFSGTNRRYHPLINGFCCVHAYQNPY